jgi:hypothetical protein
MTKKLVLDGIAGLLILALAGVVHGADLPDTVTGTASAGLIQIATTGNPEGLQRELGGNIQPSNVVADTIGQSTLNGLLMVSQDEHLAPNALVAPSGEIYAMVAPTLTKDNFILVTTDGKARRMDVGASEGNNRPFVVTAIDARALPATVTGPASAGLIQIATTGNPEGLHTELGGQIEDATIVAGTVGLEKLDALLDTAHDVHLAPKALRAPTGEIYAMVAPTITKDNFILVTTDGMVRRMDVGASEGTNQPFQVTEIVGDGGTAWYVEFWNWLTRS